MVSRNFILPESANYVFFYAVFNLRKLLYIIWQLSAEAQAESPKLMFFPITNCRRRDADGSF